MMEAWDMMGALRRLWAGKPIRVGVKAEEAPSDVKVLPRMFNVEKELGEVLLAEKVAKLKASPLPDEAHAVIRLGVLRDLYERVLWVDNPEWDGTDGAHPAWWRGQEDGVKGAVMRVREALEGNEGAMAGKCQEPLQSLREDVAALLDRARVRG